jgi:hypothetical protein
MMMLEEADGVDVQWEEDASGRKVAVLVVSCMARYADTTVDADRRCGMALWTVRRLYRARRGRYDMKPATAPKLQQLP